MLGPGDSMVDKVGGVSDLKELHMNTEDSTIFLKSLLFACFNYQN